ncbi:aggrecan core protein-like [Paramacrobiotus metropolitanus]|uniref:aggrecan core protein-like n=1 Tax=Paramacrobiotus metropolitanus TaxID=2943436 RepID=UPI0024461681|nr:aggrecan core protein-like [Paramacrobiotus metropolitanus]
MNYIHAVCRTAKNSARQLGVWQSHKTSHGLSNLKIAVDSEAGSGLPGMKLLTFHITGDSSDQIDSSSISTEFITTIQGANIPGISFETTSTDASVETSTEVTVNGGDNSNGGDNTNTNNNVNINVNGGGAGGNPFTIRGTVTITFTSDSQLNQILQQILSLWIKTYGSQFGVDSGKVKINVASKVPNGSGGYTVTFTITGTSTSTVDVTSNITDFLTIIANAHINGVVTGTISGRLQWTITIDGLFSYGSPSERDNLLQTILNLWMSNFGMQSLQFMEFIRYRASSQRWNWNCRRSYFFHNYGHVTVKYNVKSELDRILQAILKLWIQKYGSRYGATNVKIVVSSSRPTGKGTYDVTYTITGTSSVTININVISNEFQTTVSSSKITGIVIGGGSSVTDGGNGSGEGSGEITVTDNGGGPGGKNTFTYTGKVTVTVTSDSDLRGLIQAILKLWIQKYGSTYGIGNISIKITSKVSNGSGGWIITYVITGSSSKVVTINKIQGEWTITITTSQIPGITVEGETSTPVSGEDTTPGTGEDTTTPATPGGEETPAPGGEDTTTPATPGGEETPTPGGDVTPAPGGEDTTTPATPGGEETPAPGGEDTTPATPGGEETPAPGGEDTTTPATPGGEETPAPGGEDTTTPATPGGEETPAPGGEDTTTPATPGGEETPAPGGEDTTTPATPGGEETPAPGGEDTTPGTDAGSPTPPNSNEEGGSTPGGGGEITINGNGGGEGGDKTFDLTGKITVTITTDADLRAFLQAILNLWIQKYGSIYGIGNISIKITSKVPNPTGSGWIISYEITGSSSTTVTIDTIKGEWNGIIDNSGIDGVVIGTGTITIEGGNTGEGGGEGEISIEGNGGGSGGDNKFDLTGKITVTVTTDADLRTLLQAILNLWIEKYGSTYGIGSITIKITSKVPNPTGSGFIISYEITGSSSTTVTIDTIKGEWNGFIDNAGINGVVIGTGTITTEGNGGGEGSGEGEISVKGNGGGSGGDNSFTFSSTVTVTVTSNADLTTLIKAILDLWIKQYGSTYGIGDVTIKITSKQPTASGGFTISYTITGSSSTTVPTDTIQGEWTALINGAGITGIVVEGGEGASTEASAGGNSLP